MNSYKNVFTEKELSDLCDKYDVLLPEKNIEGLKMHGMQMRKNY